MTLLDDMRRVRVILDEADRNATEGPWKAYTEHNGYQVIATEEGQKRWLFDSQQGFAARVPWRHVGTQIGLCFVGPSAEPVTIEGDEER